MRTVRRMVLVCSVFFVVSSGADRVCAQAWAPYRGQSSVALSYGFTHADRHLFSGNIESDPSCGVDYACDGNAVDLGKIDSSTLSLYADYGIVNRLAVSGTVVFVSSAYSGLFPEAAIDMSRNNSFQDWGLALRYMALLKPVVVTPFIGYSGPTYNYDLVGHTAVGSGLKSLQAGLNLGRSLSPWVRSAYVHVNYGYSFVENTGIFGMDQSFLSAEAGWFFNRSIGVRFLSNFLWVHDGFDWLNNEHWEHSPGHSHDLAAGARRFRLGGGLSYSLPKYADLSLSYLATVSGENTHNLQGITFSTIFTF